MQFDLFRMALSERAQLDLFDPATRPTREAWLRDVLSREIIFMHRKEQFHYAPDPHAPPEGQDIVGRIGRKRAAVENEPPARGLVETKRDKWTAARLLIDPSHHADGQKIAMENVQSVGKPFGLLQSLAMQINFDTFHSPYQLQISPIIDADSFWDFANKHKGDVTCVTFEFIAPNMFGETDDYSKELRELKEKEKVRKAKLQLENSDGLNLDSRKVRQAVSYISPGQGTITAKTKTKQTYRSERKVKRVGVDKKDVESSVLWRKRH